MPMTNYEMFDFPGDTKRDEYFVQAKIPLTRWLYTLDAPFFCRLFEMAKTGEKCRKLKTKLFGGNFQREMK